MSGQTITVTYVGGPTALVEIGGVRFLTDPTFDPAGSEYPTPIYTLRKTQGPALTPESVGRVDAVLLSHDHHFDNLDRAGRAFLARAHRVFTTRTGADRLGPPALGLEPWQTATVPAPDGGAVVVRATPARHGPADGDRGPVIGFVLEAPGHPGSAVYVSGDTVWYEGAAQVASHFQVSVALLFTGAARVREVGPAHLTLTAEETVEAARAFADAAIVPLHYEGWTHFSEGRPALEHAFASAGMVERLRWLEPGRPVELP